MFLYLAATFVQIRTNMNSLCFFSMNNFYFSMNLSLYFHSHILTFIMCETLTELVRKNYPCLWDNSDPTYKDKV